MKKLKYILFLISLSIITSCSGSKTENEPENLKNEATTTKQNTMEGVIKTSALIQKLLDIEVVILEKTDHLLDQGLSADEIIKKMDSLMKDFETQFQELKSEYLLIAFPLMSDKAREEIMQKSLHKVESNMQLKIFDLIDEKFILPFEARLKTSIDDLSLESERLKTQIKEVFPDQYFDFSNLYGSDKKERENKWTLEYSLKENYSRSELGLLPLEYPDLASPEEKTYRFVSSDGEFKERLVNLYNDIKHSNPFHEQGKLARKCGLDYIQKSDQELLNNQTRQAALYLEQADSMWRMTQGYLPLPTNDAQNKNKMAYEACTGKHVLTGLSLKEAPL